MREPSVLVRIAAALDSSFQSAFSATEKTLAKVRTEMHALENVSKSLNSFQSLSLASEKAKLSLTRQEDALKKLKEKTKASGIETEIQSRKMSYLGNSIDQTKNKIESQTKALSIYKTTIESAGLSATKFALSEQQLASSFSALRAKELSALGAREKGQAVENARETLSQKKSDFRNTLFTTVAGGALALTSPIQYQHQLTRGLAAARDRNNPDDRVDLKRADLERITKEVALNLPISPTVAANEGAELIQAGFTLEELDKNLLNIFKIALATDTSPELSSEMIKNFKASFQFDASNKDQMEVLANTIAKSINIGSLKMSDLSASSSYLVDMPKTLGISLGDTFAMMGVLRDRNVIGSMIGTSLNAFFRRLVNPKTQEALKDKLNVDVVEKKDGKNIIRPIFKILEDIDKALSGKGNADQLGIIETIFRERSAKALGVLLQDRRDPKGKLKMYAEELRVKEILTSLKESHLELDYLDKMVLDLKTSALNGLKQPLTTLQVASYSAFKTITPEFNAMTNSINEFFKFMNEFITNSPILSKYLIMTTSAFFGLSLAMKALAVIKAGGALLAIGGVAASTTLALSGLAAALYLVYENWEKISSSKLWENMKEIFGKAYLEPNLSPQVDPKYSQSKYDNRTYTFNLELPPSPNPKAYAGILREELLESSEPMKKKPYAFSDFAEAF